ncbi:MAG: hypothetical protein HY822_03345 [Acidobacteria bacterium]|nr:hypothetical protein [Acidobacteriota bacterium]
MRLLVSVLVASACLAQPWVRHNDPLGFSVEHPPGWRVTAETSGMVRVASPDQAASVVVQPFLVARPATARGWLTLSLGEFAAALPQARITRIEQRSARPDEVIASLAYAGGGQATALCTLAGRAGMFYAIAAPQAQFASRRAELVRVLGSFRYTQLDYVRWEDPKERAFSIEVPRGWSVTGGMFRFAPVDTRAAVEIVSPDGRIRITTGDADLPTHTEPNQMLAMTGFREGSWYSPGYGVRMMVRRYVPGVNFAAEYAQRKIGARCAGLQLADQRDRPDVARQLGQAYSQSSLVAQQLTVGEVAFTCDGSMRGVYLAGTELTRTSGTGLWQVKHLAGYVAPAGQVAVAEGVLRRVVESVRINPEWERMQQGVTAASSRIVARTHAEISAGISQSYWSRQQSQDNLSRQWSNVILGQTDVTDPATGEKWKVASGHNYYWRKEGTDQVAGTDTWTRPDIDFTPLREW